MKTSDRIVEVALKLFNHRGSLGVSTNHIAAAAGISPGNLYYHFRNKEAIIRAIFDQMDAYGLEQYQAILLQHAPGTLSAMEQTFSMIQQFNWRYRFFKRELTTLITNDPLLKKRFVATNRNMLTLVRQSNEYAMATGTLVPMTESQLALFTEQVWMVTLFWLNYLDLSGEKVSAATLARGVAVLRETIRPRLSEAALKQLASVSAVGALGLRPTKREKAGPKP